MWEYFNQATNDIIEHLLNDHPDVIPTLRKIKYVDFMMEINGEVMPFDLKITHISDDYFDVFTKGLSEMDDVDSFQQLSELSELENIKNFYKSIKKEYNLPNYGGMKKTEIIKILENVNDIKIKSFVKSIYDKRYNLVNDLYKYRKSIEWWNYKYQGERLFKNNNRFFIFLVYTDCFEDARPLKGNIEIIASKVKVRLAVLKKGDYNTIKYYYNKDRGLEGAYQTISASVLVSSNC